MIRGEGRWRGELRGVDISWESFLDSHLED